MNRKTVIVISIFFVMFVISSFYAVVSEDKLKKYMLAVDKLEENQVIFVGVFGSVATFPNDFAIDAKRIYQEIRLVGRRGKIIIGSGSAKGATEYLESSEGGQETKRCGVSLLSATIDDIDYWIAWNDDSYVFFSGVDSAVVDKAMDSICLYRKDGK